MDEYQKLALDISEKNISAEKKRKRRKRIRAGVFTFIGTVIALAGLIVAIVQVVK